VALSHRFGSESLPRVVASGRGCVAEQILEIAFANGVKVRQDADLVEILAAVDVDSEIPIAAIAAVAEILARVYEANGRLRDAAAGVSDQPVATGEAGCTQEAARTDEKDSGDVIGDAGSGREAGHNRGRAAIGHGNGHAASHKGGGRGA